MQLPPAFEQRMNTILKNEMEDFRHVLSTSAPTSIRWNPLKNNNFSKKELPVPWCAEGYYLSSRPSFTFDPLFHAGTYYVQEASSMFLEVLVKHILPDRPVRVLDLCAAPGGKTTHLASLLSSGSLLVANEVIKARSNILQENLMKWGTSNVVVTNNDPADFHSLKGFFDIVLVDAPCSGEGMFRKDNAAISQWSESHVNLCAARQKRILAHAIELLAPDGCLIYSTCTFAPEENQHNVNWMVENGDFTSISINETGEEAVSPFLEKNRQ